jgi:hypothetical protein
MRQERGEEALAVFATYHANGDTEDPLVRYEYQEVVNAIKFEALASKGASYSAFFKTKGNRHRLSVLVLLGFLSQWVGMGVVSYYFAAILTSIGVTNPTQQAGINGGLQIWNWFLAIAGALAIERVGRRPLWLFATAGLLGTFIVITACSATYAQTGSSGAGYTVIAFLFLFSGFFDIAVRIDKPYPTHTLTVQYTPMALSYPVEILPYGLRTKGLAISQSCVYLALFFNQFVSNPGGTRLTCQVNPIALEAIAWRYYIVYCILIAVMLVIIYFLFPEVCSCTCPWC